MHRTIMKMLAVVSAVCITGVSFFFGNTTNPGLSVYAKTIAEIEAEKQEKQEEIQKKREQLESLAGDITKTEEYQTVLQDEIDLINGKMLLIDRQLQNVYSEIDEKNAEIAALEQKIAEQQVAVDEGLAVFKERLRAMYVHGNEGLLSALVGATDFYDVLAKIDLINRIAKHDDEMLKNLKSDLYALNENQQDLTAHLQALSLKQTEMETLSKEFSDSRDDLDAAYAKFDSERLQMIEHHHATEDDIAKMEVDLEALNAQEEALILEAARKAAEEAERKKREEEERRRAYEMSVSASESAARTTTTVTSTTPYVTTVTTATTGGNGNSKSSVTTAPTTAATRQTTTVTTTNTNPPSTGNARLAWPAPGFYHVSSEFSYNRWGRPHRGMDIAGAGIHYANACAAAAGTVILVRTGCTHDYGTACSCNGGYGNYIQIDHGNGLVTLYAHLASVSVSVGQQVTTGTPIGKIGATGNVVSSGGGGYHLHFSVIVNGVFVNPRLYL